MTTIEEAWAQVDAEWDWTGRTLMAEDGSMHPRTARDTLSDVAVEKAAVRGVMLAVLDRAHLVMCPVLGADHESGKCSIARSLRKLIEEVTHEGE